MAQFAWIVPVQASCPGISINSTSFLLKCSGLNDKRPCHLTFRCPSLRACPTPPCHLTMPSRAPWYRFFYYSPHSNSFRVNRLKTQPAGIKRVFEKGLLQTTTLTRKVLLMDNLGSLAQWDAQPDRGGPAEFSPHSTGAGWHAEGARTVLRMADQRALATLTPSAG